MGERDSMSHRFARKLDWLVNWFDLMHNPPSFSKELLQGSAGGHPNSGDLILGIVDMHIHDVGLGLRVVKSLGPFKHPPRPELFRIGKLDDLVAKSPMRQIL